MDKFKKTRLPKPVNTQRRSREPISNYLARIVLLIRFFVRICGFDIFCIGYHIGPITSMNFALCLLALPIMAYTMWSRDREIMFRACTLFGHMGQAFVKAFKSYHSRQDLVNTMHYLRTLYERNQDTTNGNEAILRRWGRLFWALSSFVTVAVISVIPVFVAYPLWTAGTLLDSREMVMPMYVPWVDENTKSGAAMLFCMQVVFLVMGTLGIMGADLIFWLQILHICPMAEMLINMLRQLDEQMLRIEEDCTAPGDFRRNNRLWSRMEKGLDNIVELHNELIGYMTNLAEIYELNNLVEILSNAMSICLTIFVRYFIDYIPMYFFLMVVLIKLTVICALGTIVELYYDQILSALEQCHWYLMSLPMQKKFVLLLLQAQRPTYLIAGSAVVNMLLYVSVMKTVYSIAMLLNEMEMT